MKVTCHICGKKAEDGDCARVIVNSPIVTRNDVVYAHDACAKEAFDREVERRKSQGKKK